MTTLKRPTTSLLFTQSAFLLRSIDIFKLF